MAQNESPSHEQYHHYALSPTTPTNPSMVHHQIHSPVTPTNLPMVHQQMHSPVTPTNLHQQMHSPVMPIISAGNLYPTLMQEEGQYDVTPMATPIHAKSEAILTRVRVCQVCNFVYY